VSRGERELGARLRELRAPGESEAEERSWEIVRAAYDEHTPVRPDRRTRRLALALAGGAVVLAIGLSPAGAKVGDLVSDVVGIGERDGKPALRSLPAEGELLVSSANGVWLVGDDGSKRLLGDYHDAAWSPNAIYVAAASGRQLVALEPDGDVRWTYTAPGEVRDPRWAGTALDTRIAYRSGDDLRVIVGDGSGDSDRLIARDVAPVAPAWRPVGESKLDPGAVPGPYVLSYVDGSGQVRSVDADTGARVPTQPGDHRRLEAEPSPAPSPGAEDRALSPDGSEIARLDHVGARDRLIVTHRGGGGTVLFSARGRLVGPTWSPDGRRVLIGWPAADQWLFIDADNPHRVDPFDRISEQFDPGGDGGGRFPRVDGWAVPGS
jgi:hypothetical protein